MAATDIGAARFTVHWHQSNGTEGKPLVLSVKPTLDAINEAIAQELKANGNTPPHGYRLVLRGSDTIVTTERLQRPCARSGGASSGADDPGMEILLYRNGDPLVKQPPRRLVARDRRRLEKRGDAFAAA